MEQLVAESTGKNGVAIIPVDREPPQPDRKIRERPRFCLSNFDWRQRLGRTRPRDVRRGPPCAVEIGLESIDNLGQEFFRWEFATAVAGAIMRINPFNQPDVESAKIEARKITDEYEQTG